MSISSSDRSPTSPVTSSGIVTHKGEFALLRALIRGGLTLRLFTNDLDFSSPRRCAAFTGASFVEASFPGYAPIDLGEKDWRVEAGPPSRAVGSPQMFTRGAGGEAQDLFGFFLTTPDGEPYGAYRFPDAPWDMRREHDAAKIIPFLHSPTQAS